MDQAKPADEPTKAITDEELEHVAGGHDGSIIVFNLSGRDLKVNGPPLHRNDH